VIEMQEGDGGKLLVPRGWCSWVWTIWHVFRWWSRPQPIRWVRLKDPKAALTQPKLPLISLQTIGLFKEHNYFGATLVEWADGNKCWCLDDDLEVVSAIDEKPQTCQHVLDEGEDGEILCSLPAANECSECHRFYCDEHFNRWMQLCDEDSEVVAARYL